MLQNKAQKVLALVDDFLTVDWLAAYPAPAFVLKEIAALLEGAAD